MSQQNTFDIVSKVDMQEVDNALNQARKEIAQRYDFKDSKSSVELKQKENEIVLLADDDFKMKALLDIVQSKMVKRSIPLKALTYGKAEPATGGLVRQVIKLQNGIDKENAKLVVKMIKDTKMKVQSQIMDDLVRVSGKNRDDLQAVIALLRQADLPFATQFVNYR